RRAFATRTRAEWVAQLGPADTCVSEVASVPELVHDEHFRARRVFVDARAAGQGSFEQVGWVLAGMDREQPGPVVREAAVTDTDALLQEAGYSVAEIAALRAEGVAA
ncbi:MAG TPA: CoA transferase, partial [Acidimicrobiia bacterium]